MCGGTTICSNTWLQKASEASPEALGAEEDEGQVEQEKKQAEYEMRIFRIQ